MYKISEFSQMTGLSKETLRYYAEVRLLEPAYLNPCNQYRYYDDGSYFLAVLRGKLRDLGFTIQEMIEVMEDESFENPELLVKQKKDKIKKEIEELQVNIDKINHFLLSGKGEHE